MATITIKFIWTSITEEETFELDGCVENSIEDFIDERECEGQEIIVIDIENDDDADADDFSDLNEFGVYAEKVEKFGEAYALRYTDIGVDFDFNDEYQGEWRTVDAFTQNLLDDYEIPEHLVCYIDYNKWSRDIMMYYSEYSSANGYYIFRD